uniref:major histocompatibility complex class I-related gene protein-like isoform X2 n=1 Tax=Solea senegalensis TaxID=28829 RepID=UPI001CD8DC9C|nr:major histocompatibility complex class I-related gene protein-like isoform X2 [Solea senegalensis]
MKILLLLVLLGIHSASARIHSLKYFYTGSSEVPNFPQFVAVGLVDDVQILHYDSNTMRAEPKQDWMRKITDPKYWESETGYCLGSQQAFKADIEIAKKRFNQTGGVHVFQKMYGCDWDDETGEINGYEQHGYDGEDFLVFDLKTETWIAPSSQAFITKNKWDADKAYLAKQKQYYTQLCPYWLKTYMEYGKSSLQRTGFKYTRKNKAKCQLLNFLIGQAKLAIYVSRRNKVENSLDVDCQQIYVRMIKTRIKTDFVFFHSTNNTEEFLETWGVKDVLCCVSDGQLSFCNSLS